MPELLVALDWLRTPPRQIVIAGNPDAPDTVRLLHEINRHYLPTTTVILADGGAGQRFFGAQVKMFKEMAPIDGAAAAYVCENFVCQLPTNKLTDLARMLSEPKAKRP